MKEELLELLKKHAYKKGEFKLSSGKTSEHYVNCKPVTLTGRGLTLSSLLLLKEVETDYVGGLTLGADPLVSGVSLVSDFKIKENQKVLIVEDVITTGGSAIKAATRLRDAGYVVERVVAIVDRQEDKEADEFMESADLELRSLFTLGDVINAKNE